MQRRLSPIELLMQGYGQKPSNENGHMVEIQKEDQKKVEEIPIMLFMKGYEQQPEA
ncbi:hypothetical protein ACEOWG_002152 [Bacillus cereus]